MKKTQTYSRYFCLAGTAVAVSGNMAFALEPSDVLVFSHGPLSLRPQFVLTESFDDNVFYSQTGLRSDLITTVSPGLKFQIGQDFPDQNHFSILYMLDKSVYIDNPGLNALQHRVQAEAHYTQPRFGIDGSDTYQVLSSVLGGGFNVGRQKVDRNIWWDVYRFDYKIGERTGVYAEAQHVETDYKTQLSLLDTRTLTGTGGFQYSYSEDTFFFGEVYYGQTTLHPNAPGAEKPPGTSFIGGFIGARGNFTEKIRGSVKAGYEASTFSGGSTQGVDTSAGSAPVVEASVSYTPTDRLTATLKYSRRQQVSVQFVRSSYVLDSVSASLAEQIGSTRRLRLDLSTTYAMYSFDPAAAYPAGRTDSNWSVKTGADYFFQTWLYTRLEYSFERFTSDFASVVDYDVNRVTLSLAIGY
jgi:hypothetical protein